MKINPDAPAFPGVPRGLSNYAAPGLTIRQYYAGEAMKGLVAGFPRYANERESCARYAVALADALIAELNNKT